MCQRVRSQVPPRRAGEERGCQGKGQRQLVTVITYGDSAVYSEAACGAPCASVRIPQLPRMLCDCSQVTSHRFLIKPFSIAPAAGAATCYSLLFPPLCAYRMHFCPEVRADHALPSQNRQEACPAAAHTPPEVQTPGLTKVASVPTVRRAVRPCQSLPVPQMPSASAPAHRHPAASLRKTDWAPAPGFHQGSTKAFRPRLPVFRVSAVHET